MYTIQITTPPTGEPISTTDVQNLLRVNSSTENGLIGPWITAARVLFERASNLCLMTQTVTQFMETPPPYVTYLMRGPIQSVSSVKYYDTTGTLQTASGFNTDLVTGGMGRLWWPNGQPAMSSTVRPVMQVEFVAGFGDSADDVPAPIKQAIALLACYWFEQRTPYSDQRIENVPQGFEAIIDAYRIGNVGQWGMDWNDRHSDPLYANTNWPWMGGGWWY